MLDCDAQLVYGIITKFFLHLMVFRFVELLAYTVSPFLC